MIDALTALPLLLLPGVTEGLLLRCSPVTDVEEHGSGVVLGSDGPRTFMVGFDHPSGWRLVAATGLQLELDEKTGREHAKWWLAKKVNSIGSEWERKSVLDHPGTYWELGGVVFHCLDGVMWRGALDDIKVSALAELDPDDPRLLPDGSRWVDAEVLRLAVLHVAGQEVSHG